MKYYLSLKNRIKNINSDFIGAMSAFLCIIHCAIVPILMGVHSVYYAGDALTSTKHLEHSHNHSDLSSGIFHSVSIFDGSHWHALDYFFIVITLIAVYFATRKSVVSWITAGLWMAASLFVISILLEETITEIKYLSYLASALLIVFHFLNQKLGGKIKNKKNEKTFDNSNLKTEIKSKKSNRVSCAC